MASENNPGVGFAANALAKRISSWVRYMSVFRALVFLVALAWFPGCATAEDAKPRAAQLAIDNAKSCDDDIATRFSRLNNESAEIVARATFEKCLPVWQNAHKVYFEERAKNDRRPYTDEELKRNPYLLSGAVDALNADTEENSIENWKRPEIERLLVMVMEARLKSARTD
jgi:hypothetical protein